MAGRKKKRATPTLGGFDFHKINPYGDAPDSGGADASFAERKNIYSIMPDPEQPRRLLPPDLYDLLYSGDKSPIVVLKEWLYRSEQPAAPTALIQSVKKLRELAETIAHHDLINPIVIRPVPENIDVPVGITHLIITGERRWWSHVLLTMENRPIQESNHPDRIKISVMEDGNIRALQLIENLAREDLSLVDKAYGISSLKVELENQRGKVSWSEIDDLLGLSRSYRSRIMRIFRLSDEAINLVSLYGLSERVVRPIIDHLEKFPELQLTILMHIAQWQTDDSEPVTHKRVESMIHQLLQQQIGNEPLERSDKSERIQRSGTVWEASKLQQRIRSTMKTFQALSQDDLSAVAIALQNGKQADIQQIEQLRNQLDTLLEMLNESEK